MLQLKRYPSLASEHVAPQRRSAGQKPASGDSYVSPFLSFPVNGERTVRRTTAQHPDQNRHISGSHGADRVRFITMVTGPILIGLFALAVRQKLKR